MKSSIITQTKTVGALLVALLLSVGAGSSAWAGKGNAGNPGILPPQSHSHGKTYGEWSAAWWQWFMEHPVSGHPSVASPNFDVSSGQKGNVWFLASPFGTVERAVNLPAGKALFIGLLNAEASDLEELGDTEAAQRETAAWIADHIVRVACSVDGVAVQNLGAYRVQSPQFSFTALDSWIFSPSPGGEGTAVADGYFLMLAPLSKGEHTIQIAGAFHFSVAEGDPFNADFALDMTYHLNVK